MIFQYAVWIFLLAESYKQTMLMAHSDTAENNIHDALRKKIGVKRLSKHNLRIDMTPMVDLGFLLITFFVITTELSRPTTMDIAMPKEGPPMPLAESSALTILIDKENSIYCYEGKWEQALKENAIKKTSLAGTNSIRNIIMAKQQKLDINNKAMEGRNGLMMLIKPGDNANYRTIIDFLDEATISVVKKYAIVNQTKQEALWLSQR